MARYPEPGKSKTRLIPALGEAGAASLHGRLVSQTLSMLNRFIVDAACDIEIRFTGGSEQQMQSMFGEPYCYRQQRGALLGDRMSDAVEIAFQEGFDRVLVIGTDCPDLTEQHLADAFSSLVESQVVIGPANDGGYYLIGQNSYEPSLFEQISWGTEVVFAQTMERAAMQGLSVTTLPTLSDIDYPEDLIRLRTKTPEYSDAIVTPGHYWLSVVIPTFNEEQHIARTLGQFTECSGVEVIVSDGGSGDRTCEIAYEKGVRVIRGRCESGRGRQLNAGAAVAGGDVLMFLHADTKLPDDFLKSVRECINLGNRAGAFRLGIESQDWMYRIIEFGANLRSRWFQLPYGDQAIFVKADLFYNMSGFQPWPLMEDYELCQRLRRLGRICLADTSVKVSPRRWQKLGILRTTVLNQAIVLAYKFGKSPESLAAWYRGTAIQKQQSLNINQG
ncbi:MAG: TIGR04283 family arsenosugar biosynthesis glycosyltransferase [Planctomyces sp.]|nr:TIGR04283 family arsenosugar biosynthesis glycosyltransferase [Planctomyces sp.]